MFPIWCDYQDKGCAMIDMDKPQFWLEYNPRTGSAYKILVQGQSIKERLAYEKAQYTDDACLSSTEDGAILTTSPSGSRDFIVYAEAFAPSHILNKLSYKNICEVIERSYK